MFWDESSILYSILAVAWIEYFWEFYLDFRQNNVYKTSKRVPTELENIVTAETYEKSRLYGLDKSNFAVVRDFISQIILTGTICFFLCKHAWDASGHLAETLNFEKTEIVLSAFFMVILITFSTVTSLPFSVYNTFVLEEKHGFNKQTCGFYIKDQIKGYLVSIILAAPLTCGMVYIIQIGGDYFFIYLWLFAMAMIFFFMTIYPDFIAPLFDKYTLLPEGELKKQIEELALSQKFPLYKLYLVEGSKRSVHSNAYLYGFFKNKRIVLFDTLLKNQGSGKGCETEEIVAILAHELGHWKLSHIVKNMIIVQFNLFLQFFMFAQLFKYPLLYRAFGFYHEQPIIVGFIIIMKFVFSPYNALLSFLVTTFTRKCEFEADAFAASLGKGEALSRGLIKIHTDNLSFPVYDWLYSMWHHSHPTLLQRLEALRDKKKD